MSRLRLHLTLGFHGCDRETGTLARDDKVALRPSQKRHDWLGPGVYFWEGDPQRAAEWAHEKATRGRLKEAFVVGAVIDLGNCLDLTLRENFTLLEEAYEGVKAAHKAASTPLPENGDAGRQVNGDKLLRYLDCEVITYLHKSQESALAEGLLPTIGKFDTVRSPFFEGDPVYPNGGFYRKTHTQIAVLNPDCIVGIFRPRGIAEIIRQAAPPTPPHP